MRCLVLIFARLSTFVRSHCWKRVLLVRTPSVLSEDSVNVEATVEVNGMSFSDPFQFKESLTWKVTSISPTRLSPATSGIVEFRLANMIHGADMPIEVMIGNRECQQPTLNTTAGTLRCVLIRGDPPSLPQDPVSPFVHIASLGYADANSYTIDVGYRVTGLSMDRGSVLGGQHLKIFGFGFGDDKDRLEIRIQLETEFGDWVLCETSNVTNDEIKCVTPPVESYMEGRNVTLASIEVRRSRMVAPCDGNSSCAFAFSHEFTPECTMVQSENSPKGLLTLMGRSLLFESSSVYVGGEKCKILHNSSDAETLECVLPYNRAGRLPIDVDTDFGTANCPFTVDYSLVVDSVSGNQGSLLGGHPVTFKRYGFSKISQENIV